MKLEPGAWELEAESQWHPFQIHSLFVVLYANQMSFNLSFIGPISAKIIAKERISYSIELENPNQIQFRATKCRFTKIQHNRSQNENPVHLTIILNAPSGVTSTAGAKM